MNFFVYFNSVVDATHCVGRSKRVRTNSSEETVLFSMNAIKDRDKKNFETKNVEG
jgi:hypothetical protein